GCQRGPARRHVRRIYRPRTGAAYGAWTGAAVAGLQPLTPTPLPLRGREGVQAGYCLASLVSSIHHRQTDFSFLLDAIRMATTVTSPDAKHVKQAVSGVVPPELSEGLIRQVLPSVTDSPGLATLCEKMMRTIVLAPLAWLLLAVPYFKKVLPITAK